MAHTKNKWKIVRDDQGMIRGVEADSGWICDTQFNSIESCEANAKLIAAAPDNTASNVFMTNKVKACIDVLQRHILPDSKLSDKDAMAELYQLLDNSEIVNELKKSQAAIKKATE